MYPGEGMHVGDDPHHRHHLPKLDDDDDDDHHHHHHHHHHDDQDDNDHSSDSSHHQHHHHQKKQKHGHPPNGNTPPPHRHHPTPPPKRTPTPSLRPQQPLQPPTPLVLPQPLQPPTPILPQPPLQPPILLQQPPPPSSPPRKPQPPPPMDLNHPHHYNDTDDDDDKHKPPNQQVVAATLFIVLLLLGLTFLILWLIYRPSKPHFSAVSTLIYTLNTTSATVAASMQFIIHTTNPNKRTTLSYDHLTATVYYRSTAITPPVSLPPLFHLKHSSVIIAPVIGGPPPAVEVPVGWEVANGLLSEEAYGVVGFSWVVTGRVRYRVGGVKSGRSRVYVKCDVVVKLTGVNNGVYVNSAGQVPLLASPPCLVDF